MTAEDLLAIQQRHIATEGHLMSHREAEADADRATLLDLLRCVAQKAWSGPGIDRHGEMRISGFGFVRPRYRSDDQFHDECIFCEAEPGKGEVHTADCPAPLLEVLRP